jgi:hypothetical protein
MLSRTRTRLWLGLAAVMLAPLAAFATASGAHAAYLSLGLGNTSNATTTLTGNPSAAELLVKNTKGSSAAAFGLYGLLTATAPTASAAGVRGSNASTNGHGYGVWGSQAGSGSGVYGYAPSGRGVYGLTSTGIGVRGTSTSGTGVLGQHLSTSGTAPGVEGLTSSTSGLAAGVYGASSSSARGVAGFSNSWQGVYGHSNSQAGVVGESGSFDGVWGQAHSFTQAGVSGHNDGEGFGVWGGTNSGDNAGVYGTGPFVGVQGDGSWGVWGTGSSIGVYGYSYGGKAVYGESSSGDAITGESVNGAGIHGLGKYGVVGGSGSNDAVRGISSASGYAGIYGENSTGATNAGYFAGHVQINGGCTGCAGPSLLQIDDPLDPAHKYLQHSSVASSQQLDLYSGNTTTNAKGFATVTMPRWFQALNRSFRYQLTVVGRAHWEAKAAVWTEIKDNRFTIRTDQPNVKVSWLVTGIRHDRYANANPTQVIVPKPKAEQGRYVHPELYGKPRSDGIGYQKPPKAPRVPRRR